MSERTIAWAKGGHADILEIDRLAVRVVSTVPSPPGSTIVGTFSHGDSQGELRMKVFASKLQTDGTFVLNGRPIDLTTQSREALVATISRLSLNDA